MRNLKGISKDLNYRVGYSRGYKKGLEEGRRFRKPTGFINKVRFILRVIKTIFSSKTNGFTIRYG